MRLTRTGARKRPSYRVIVADSRAPRDGRHVEILGYYDPMTKPTTIKIDVDKAVQWLRDGAQPSERVRVLLRHSGVLKAWEERRLADKREHKEHEEERRESRAAKMAHAAERRTASEARSAAATKPAAKAATKAAPKAEKASAGKSAAKPAAKPAASEESKPKRTTRRKASAE